jgi:hypothetical protein
MSIFRCTHGRAIAQGVSRRLPTAAARVRAWVWSCGICGERSGAGTGFLRVLRFPLPIFIPPTAPQSPSSIIWDWHKRPIVVAVLSGLSLISLRRIIIIKTGVRMTLITERTAQSIKWLWDVILDIFIISATRRPAVKTTRSYITRISALDAIHSPLVPSFTENTWNFTFPPPIRLRWLVPINVVTLLYCQVREWIYTGFGLVTRFIDHGWGTMLQAGRSRVRVPMRLIFFNLPNPPSRTVTLGSTEMSIRDLLGG